MNVPGTLSYAGDYRLPTARPRADPEPSGITAWGGDGFGFDDLLDVVNPLQHLPGVSTVYRAASDDGIGAIPRLLGGLLFGGLFGLAAAAVNVVVQAFSGRDIGEHVTAAFLGPQRPVLGEEQRMLAWYPTAPEPSATAESDRLAAEAYRRVAAFAVTPPPDHEVTLAA
ncbi:MAG: hypothetical protein ACOC3D_08210 [Pseudomonadota bacterium]